VWRLDITTHGCEHVHGCHEAATVGELQLQVGLPQRTRTRILSALCTKEHLGGGVESKDFDLVTNALQLELADNLEGF
jgi:hypothetical protein